jgi:hypothetical protein
MWQTITFVGRRLGFPSLAILPPDRLISLFAHDPTKFAILGTWGGHNRSYRSIIASPKLARETRLWGGSCRVGVSFFIHGMMGRLLSSHGGWKLGCASQWSTGLGVLREVGTGEGEWSPPPLLGTPIFIMYIRTPYSVIFWDLSCPPRSGGRVYCLMMAWVYFGAMMRSSNYCSFAPLSVRGTGILR